MDYNMRSLIFICKNIKDRVKTGLYMINGKIRRLFTLLSVGE